MDRRRVTYKWSLSLNPRQVRCMIEDQQVKRTSTHDELTDNCYWIGIYWQEKGIEKERWENDLSNDN